MPWTWWRRMSSLDSLMLPAERRNSLERATAAAEKNLGLPEVGSFLEPRGITFEAASASRLGCLSEPIPGFERFVGMLAIPYLTGSGAVVAIKYRCIRDHDCKAEGCQRYDAPDGQKAKLYNAGALAKPGAIAAVVEGELKARVVSDVLGIPAVGTSAGVWMDHWPRCLADFDRVLVIADNDEPGLKHAKGKVLKTISGAELVVPPADHPKIDDWINEVGVEPVRKALNV